MLKPTGFKIKEDTANKIITFLVVLILIGGFLSIKTFSEYRVKYNTGVYYEVKEGIACSGDKAMSESLKEKC